ncbi:DUF2642 domain-containing protein [Paenibacillus sp. HWE-109]|uniref:DUF2642 domain-containing protein n=1 Tax=Paenibacillus sp. HWE-109 TaxID=1306526 RepID=UPI001EE0B797|nr:DUF2642 domain-containing protein [Paenibacillus sp. HWE-109]UKS29178.1 DUF2642 domain-containing protein [Paenibacillus sp. HWE-109]
MLFAHSYLGKLVHIELLGDRDKMGYLVDAGPDVFVIYMDKKYVYVPSAHVKTIKLNTEDKTNTDTAPDPINQTGAITFILVLHNAIDKFVEIYISDHQSIHGYVKAIAQDYLVFYSQFYKTMYIPLDHLKWITPFESDQTPYSLDQKHLSKEVIEGSVNALPPTFEQLMKGLEGEMVGIDSGLKANKIGLLQTINNSFVELITAEELKFHYNLQHIKNCIPLKKESE